MLYKYLVVFIIIILLMFSIHYVKPNTPVREGFFDSIASIVNSAVASVSNASDDKPKPKPKPAGAPTFRWWWSQPNANGWGKWMSGVDVVSKSYYDKQVKKKEKFYNEHRWVCLPGSDVPVRIHPYNKYILEQHPSSMRGNRDQRTKICRGYNPIVYDKNAQHGDPNKRPPSTRYKVNWSGLFRRIGELNDDYGEEPITKKGGGFYRLNEYYNNENKEGSSISIEGKRWQYWYEYASPEEKKNKINATHVILRGNGHEVKLKIPDTIKELNDVYGVYCANHIPENSFYYTANGIGSSDEWPDDAIITNFNCDTGPFPPKVTKTDIFKGSNYVNDRNGKPIHENVKRYNVAGPRENLVLECEESYREGRPNNCRNPALWERRCKAVKNLCEENLKISLVDNTQIRSGSDACKSNKNGVCSITHPSCNVSGYNKDIHCSSLLKDRYDKSNPGETSYWSEDIYSRLGRTTEPGLSSEEMASRSRMNASSRRDRSSYSSKAEELYFKNKEIYGKFVSFAELATGKGTLG